MENIFIRNFRNLYHQTLSIIYNYFLYILMFDSVSEMWVPWIWTRNDISVTEIGLFCKYHEYNASESSPFILRC